MRWALGVALLSACAGDPPPDPPVDPETLHVEIGPIPLEAREEKTVCITLELENEEPVFLRALSSRISGPSHHFIVYRASGGEIRPEPYPCSPFVDLLAGGVPLGLTQGRAARVEYPDGVGLRLAARQRLRLELHAIDTTGAGGEVNAAADLEVVPVDETTIEANHYVWGVSRIEVPAHDTATRSVFFRPPPPDPTHTEPLRFIALTTHTHALATRATIERAAALDDPGGEPLHESLDWAEPPIEDLDPPLIFDGSDGFRLTCTWDNTTDEPVAFGESARAEMCFMIGTYYPSRGFLVGLR